MGTDGSVLPHQERAEEYARRHGAKYAFTSLEEMAASDCIDAVYISSPNALHYENSKAFLERGKHVICEKPLCAQASKVRELQRIAQEHGAVFLEAIMYLHLPQRKLLEDTLQQLGQISLVKLDFCQRSSKLDRYLQGELPNIFNPALETGALMDLGVYCVYPALALFGKPESFSLQPHMMDSGADGAGIATLRYPDKLVTLTYSKLGQAGANSDFQGTEGTLCGIHLPAGRGFSVAQGWNKRGLYGDDEKYKLMGWEAKDFFRYITEPDASAAEYAGVGAGLQVSELMEAMWDQAGIHFASDRGKNSA